MEGPPYPKAQPNASRRDAYPPEGGPQGSSLSFMQQQHLDPNNVVLGVLNPLATGQGIRNHDLAAAVCSAINDWQIEKWTSQDSRLKGSVVVANEDGPTAAAEIRKRAGRSEFRPGAAAQPQRRAAGTAPLLADLRGRRGGGASGRRPCLRLRRQSDHGLGLAELLHRGDGRPFAVPADRAGEPGAGRRVRAASETEDDHGRGRLRLGAVAVVAARQEFRAAAQRGAASQAQAVRIHPRPHLVDHAADGRSGKARASVPVDRLDRLGQTLVRHRLSALGL